jgi:hypothetical protein
MTREDVVLIKTINGSMVVGIKKDEIVENVHEVSFTHNNEGGIQLQFISLGTPIIPFPDIFLSSEKFEQMTMFDYIEYAKKSSDERSKQAIDEIINNFISYISAVANKIVEQSKKIIL